MSRYAIESTQGIDTDSLVTIRENLINWGDNESNDIPYIRHCLVRMDKLREISNQMRLIDKDLILSRRLGHGVCYTALVSTDFSPNVLLNSPIIAIARIRMMSSFLRNSESSICLHTRIRFASSK